MAAYNGTRLVPRPIRQSGSSPSSLFGSRTPYSYRYLGKDVRKQQTSSAQSWKISWDALQTWLYDSLPESWLVTFPNLTLSCREFSHYLSLNQDSWFHYHPLAPVHSFRWEGSRSEVSTWRNPERVQHFRGPTKAEWLREKLGEKPSCWADPTDVESSQRYVALNGKCTHVILWVTGSCKSPKSHRLKDS